MSDESGPREVWFRQTKDGSWDWSFDPPTKRHELKFARLVNASRIAALESENAELRAKLALIRDFVREVAP